MKSRRLIYGSWKSCQLERERNSIMKAPVLCVVFFLAACQPLYRAHNGETPHGYQSHSFGDGRVEVSFESFRPLNDDELCELAEQRLNEINEGAAWTVTGTALDSRQELSRIEVSQATVSAAEAQYERYSVWQTVSPAYEMVRTIRRCTLTAEKRSASG
jgi:hypothetical protein